MNINLLDAYIVIGSLGQIIATAPTKKLANNIRRYLASRRIWCMVEQLT